MSDIEEEIDHGIGDMADGTSGGRTDGNATRDSSVIEPRPGSHDETSTIAEDSGAME